MKKPSERIAELRAALAEDIVHENLAPTTRRCIAIELYLDEQHEESSRTESGQEDPSRPPDWYPAMHHDWYCLECRRVTAPEPRADPGPDECSPMHEKVPAKCHKGREFLWIGGRWLLREAHEQNARPTSRWRALEATSPSGKTLFVCLCCGRISPTPDKRCPEPAWVVVNGLPEQLKCEHYADRREGLDGK